MSGSSRGPLWLRLPCSHARSSICKKHISDRIPYELVYPKHTVCGGAAAAQKTHDLQTVNRAPIELLPTELLAQIAKNLDTISQACLALCSKTLQYHVGTDSLHYLSRKAPGREVSHREAFLELLCKDLHSDLIYCKPHRLLRRRKLILDSPCCAQIATCLDRNRSTSFCRLNTTRARRNARDLPFSTPMFALAYLQVHLITHHGLCLHTLECTSFWIRPHPLPPSWTTATKNARPLSTLPFLYNTFVVAPGRNLTLEHSVSALRSLDSSSLLLEIKYAFGRQGDFDLREAVMDLEFSVCNHVLIGRNLAGSGGGGFLGKSGRKRVEIPVHNARWISSLHKCSYCPTEFMMLRKHPCAPHYHTVHGYHNTSIEIRVWHALGDGKPDGNRQWSRLVQREAKEVFKENGPAGEVKRAFNAAFQQELAKGS